MLTSDQVLEQLRKLSPRDQLRIISVALFDIEKSFDAQPRPRKSLRGLWTGSNITSKDIFEVRKSINKNFPRSDF